MKEFDIKGTGPICSPESDKQNRAEGNSTETGKSIEAQSGDQRLLANLFKDFDSYNDPYKALLGSKNSTSSEETNDNKELPRVQLPENKSSQTGLYSNYELKDGKIVDKTTKKALIQDINKISKQKRDELIKLFGGIIDSSGNITLGQGESQFKLNTNANSIKRKTDKSTYSMSQEDYDKMAQEVSKAPKGGDGTFSFSNIKAAFNLSDKETYEGGLGAGLEKVANKQQMVIKLFFKKLIEIAGRNHGIRLDFEKALGGDFQKILLLAGISLSEDGNTRLMLSVQHLKKLEKVMLGQFGERSFVGSQMSYAAEFIHKMHGVIRELNAAIVYSKSGNHNFGKLGSEFVSDPAYKQYFEYYGHFQGAKEIKATAGAKIEITDHDMLSISGGIGITEYNDLGNNVLGEKIKTENNRKVSPIGKLGYTHQTDDDKWRFSPEIGASSTMRQGGLKVEHMFDNGVVAEAKAGHVQHVGTGRPSETSFFAGLNYTFGGTDKKGKFGPLFEGSLNKKSTDLLSRLQKVGGAPLLNGDLVNLASTMSGRSTKELMKSRAFMEVVKLFANKLGIQEVESRLSTPDGLAGLILLIDIAGRKATGAGVIDGKYSMLVQFDAADLDKLNKSRKGIKLEELVTNIHSNTIEGRAHLDKVSIAKTLTGSGVEVSADGSITIDGSASGKLIFPSKASTANPSGAVNLFDVTGVSTIYVSPENVKQLPLGTTNLSFRETGGTYFNISITIVHGSKKFEVSALTNKISGMPSDLSVAMVNNQINSVILTSLLTGTQLSIATAADMHFHRGDFTTSLVNYFINGTYSYLVMNGVKNGTYSAADIAKLQAGQYTNAEAEAILTGANTPDVPTFTINGGASYTNNSTITLAIGVDAKANAWFVSESATAPAAGDAGWTTTKPTSYTLSGGDGAKNVYVYAKSASGTIQSTGGTHSITLDTVAPSGLAWQGGITPNTQGTPYNGLLLRVNAPSYESLTGGTITSITATDGANNPLAGVNQPTGYSIDGSGDIQFNWTTPNLAGAKLVIQGTDKAGNSFTINKPVSLPNSADTTPPTSPAFTIAQGNYTNTTSIGINVTANADVAGWYISESSSVPAAGDAGWTASAPTTFTISSGDGPKTVYMFSKDAAQNVQSTPGTKNITLDTVAPSGTPTFTSAPINAGTAYSLELTTSENLTGGSITSITSSNGGAIGGVTINASGNIAFNWTTPNAPGSQLVITGTDKAGNAFSLTKNVALNRIPTFGVGSVADTLTIGASGDYILPTATDADGHTLTYSFDTTRVGTGIAFDTATGVMSGGITDGPARTETIPYTVSDGHGGTATINVIFTIS